jgi:type I restriction enzyme R subunit
MAASNYAGKPLVRRARALRARQTPWEAELWDALRAGRCQGLKFRRQHQVGPHILDFYCAQPKLALELDGAQNRTAAGRALDAERDQTLAALGIQVLRFSNGTPVAAIEAAIAAALRATA